MWEADDVEAASRRRLAWLVGIIGAAVVAGGGAYYWFTHREAPPPQVTQAPPPPPATNAEPPVAHPIAAEGEGTALPALNDSDQVVHDSLAGVVGREPIEQFLEPQNIVRRIVVTVDNLPRKKLAVDRRPVKATPGQTVVATQGDLTTLSPDNYARYAPLMKVLEHTDMKALALVYQHLYPLFQQSYEDLGYPGKYFNDRLVEVIDHLLQTPEITTPVALTQPKVFYEYADPELESRSAGQKLLIRMGAANEHVIKDKLREFRAEIVKKK